MDRLSLVCGIRDRVLGLGVVDRVQMSRTALSIILALVAAFAAYMTVLNYLNAAQADKLLREKINRPSCISVPYQASERGGQCYVRS